MPSNIEQLIHPSKEQEEKRRASLRKYRPSLEIRKKLSELHKGVKSYRWKGGITPANRAIRSSFEYRIWREAVFARDNWTCQNCFVRGGKLQADHIKPFAYYPELRFAIDNGRTLCKSCHLQTETWGRRAEKWLILN